MELSISSTERDAFFERAHGIEQVRHQQAIHDEAAAIGGAHDRLAESRAERYGFVKHFWIRGDGANELHHFHHRHGIEEMHADEAIGARGERGHLCDGKRGGVAGENRLLGANLIEGAVKLRALPEAAR